MARTAGKLARDLQPIVQFHYCCRLQAMQKMQQAAGGKGRGLNGMPTPAQIQALQRSMPPGMLQQMQRQLRNGGSMQEMMKAMMQGQGGDQLDVEEMQRTFISPH